MPKKNEICFKEGDLIPKILKQKKVKVFPPIEEVKKEKKVSKKETKTKTEPKTKPKKDKVNIKTYGDAWYDDDLYIQTLSRLYSKLMDIQFNKMKNVNDWSKFSNDEEMNKELQLAFSNPRKLNKQEREDWNDNKDRINDNISEFIQEEFARNWEKFKKIEEKKPSKGMFNKPQDIGKAFYKYISSNLSKEMDIDYKPPPASAKKIVEKEVKPKPPKRRRRTKEMIEFDNINIAREKKKLKPISIEQYRDRPFFYAKILKDKDFVDKDPDYGDILL